MIIIKMPEIFVFRKNAYICEREKNQLKLQLWKK